MGVHHVGGTVDDSHPGQFLNGEVRGFLVAHVPEVITLFAEVLQADPDGIIRLLDHVGTPVVENLDAAHLIARVLHVNPAIRNNGRIAEGLHLCGVADTQMTDEQTDRNEVTIRQAVGNTDHLLVG